jgi:CheY-like chemotaxis protein
MSKLNILIVEDEFLVGADIEESLLSLGYNVQKCVPSGPAAIAEVERKLPDLILMDIRLKGEMTGIDASNIIREKHDVPIIYLTANADLGTIEQAKTSLPYGYITKPFTEKDLQTNIEIARFKFENDIQMKIESDQYNALFKKGDVQQQQLFFDGEEGLMKLNPDDIYYADCFPFPFRFFCKGKQEMHHQHPKNFPGQSPGNHPSRYHGRRHGR